MRGMLLLHVVPSSTAALVLLAVGARAGAPLTLSNSVVRASIDGSGGERTHCMLRPNILTFRSSVTNFSCQALAAAAP